MKLPPQVCLLILLLTYACAGRQVEVAADRGPSGRAAVLTMVLRSELLKPGKVWLVADAESFRSVAGLDSSALAGIVAAMKSNGTVGVIAADGACAESELPCVGMVLKFYRESADHIEIYLDERTPPPRHPCAHTYGHHFYLSRKGGKVSLDMVGMDRGIRECGVVAPSQQ